MISNPNSGELTSMELALLHRFWGLYGCSGFPTPDHITLQRREDSGAGRYLTLSSDCEVQMRDGYYDMGGAFVELSCLEDGLMAVIAVENGRIRSLEMTPYGDTGWSGDEAGWRIV